VQGTGSAAELGGDLLRLLEADDLMPARLGAEVDEGALSRQMFGDAVT
jgi:hypothetical protein